MGNCPFTLEDAAARMRVGEVTHRTEEAMAVVEVALPRRSSSIGKWLAIMMARH